MHIEQEGLARAQAQEDVERLTATVTSLQQQLKKAEYAPLACLTDHGSRTPCKQPMLAMLCLH